MTQAIIRGGTIVRPSGLEQADLLIEDGTIRNVGTAAEARTIIDAEGKLLFPGLIDCHVHFREPGFKHKGTMKTEAQSACAGGITTVCDMPNTHPPTVTVADFEEKAKRARKIQECDIRLFFGVTEYRHLMEFRRLWAAESEELAQLKRRCCGVKIYLDHSTGDQKVEEELVGEIFQACAELGAPLVAHCEDPAVNAKALQANSREDSAAHSVVRPPESEVQSIAYAIGLARKYGTHFHIAHLSTGQGVELVRQAKREGVRVSCEAAPHHLFLNTGDYEALGPLAKMNPPLRSPENQDALWAGVQDGTVDCIASDHAPHTRKEKEAGFPLSAPSGVPGVETMLPLLLTLAANAESDYHIPYTRIAELLFANPNSIFSLGKQGIAEGAPADISIVDPQKEWVITGEDLSAKCGWTPYEGWTVRGSAAVLRTML